MFDIQKQMEGILWDGVLHTGSGSALLVNIFCHLETHWTLGIFIVIFKLKYFKNR